MAHSGGYVMRIQSLPNNRFASCAGDTTIKVWSAQTWSFLVQYTGHTNWIQVLEYLYNDMISSGGDENAIHIWDSVTGAHIRTISDTGCTIYALQLITWFKGLSTLSLASSGPGGNLLIWDIQTGNLTTVLYGHTNTITHLELLNDNVLVSASDDRTIIVWDLIQQSIMYVINTGQTQTLTGLRIISSMSIIACASYDASIKLYDANANGALIRTLDNHTDRLYAYTLDLVDSSQQVLVSGSYDKTIKYWQIPTGELLDTIDTGLNILCLCQLDTSSKIYFKKLVYILDFLQKEYPFLLTRNNRLTKQKPTVKA